MSTRVGLRVGAASMLASTPPPPNPVQMLVDDIGDVTITNDGATILKQLEVEHPAAKVSRPSALNTDSTQHTNSSSLAASTQRTNSSFCDSL